MFRASPLDRESDGSVSCRVSSVSLTPVVGVSTSRMVLSSWWTWSRPAVKSTIERENEREMFYLTTHSTHFIYGYMASEIWLRTILIVRKETRCRHIGYSYRLTARVLLYAPSHRQDNTYHSLCYTSRYTVQIAW